MIRLTLITLGCVFAAMLVWGTDSGDEATVALGQPDVVEPVETPVVEPVIETVAERVAEPIVEVVDVAETEPLIQDAETITEVTKLETLDLTTPARPSNLIVVQSSDAPAGEPLLRPVTAAVTETVAETTGTTDLIASATPTILAVNASSVNLRSGPSTSVAIVGNLKRGERAELVAEAADGWLQIREISTGQIGYMAGRFLDPVLQ